VARKISILIFCFISILPIILLVSCSASNNQKVDSTSDLTADDLSEDQPENVGMSCPNDMQKYAEDMFAKVGCWS